MNFQHFSNESQHVPVMVSVPSKPCYKAQFRTPSPCLKRSPKSLPKRVFSETFNFIGFLENVLEKYLFVSNDQTK